MQSLTPSADHNPSGHLVQDILATLQGLRGARRLEFRYELYDSAGTYLRDLDNVTSCTVRQNWLADIKRTATMSIRDTGVINFLSDRILPWIRLYLAPYGPQDWVEWPQGFFSLASPIRSASASGQVTREVQGYDLLQQVADVRATDRYVITAGTPYITALRTLLNAVGLPYPTTYPPTFTTLPAAREWDLGTPYLKIVNELLGSLNYESLSFGETGRATVRAYGTPAARGEEYVYADDARGLMVPDHQQVMDLFNIPNQWILAVSTPDRPALRSVYTNTDPGSPTSTVRRGRTITAEPEFVDAADQATLDAMTARRAFEASQVYEAIEFSTALMPMHSGNDVYRIQYGPLAISAKYAEHSWEMELRAGARMRHRARRVVQV